MFQNSYRNLNRRKRLRRKKARQDAAKKDEPKRRVLKTFAMPSSIVAPDEDEVNVSLKPQWVKSFVRRGNSGNEAVSLKPQWGSSSVKESLKPQFGSSSVKKEFQSINSGDETVSLKPQWGNTSQPQLGSSSVKVILFIEYILKIQQGEVNKLEFSKFSKLLLIYINLILFMYFL